MSNTAPLTNRPETVEQVRYKWHVKPVTICSAPELAGDKAIARWWGNVLSTAMDVPALALDSSGAIIRPRTEQEIQEYLEGEQKDYDRGRETYQKWLDEGEYPTYQVTWSDYLHYEGIDIPDRPEENTND